MTPAIKALQRKAEDTEKTIRAITRRREVLERKRAALLAEDRERREEREAKAKARQEAQLRRDVLARQTKRRTNGPKTTPAPGWVSIFGRLETVPA